MSELHPLTQALRTSVENYAEDSAGSFQWYVDEFTIDCAADKFWSVVDETIRSIESNDSSSYELGRLAYDKFHEGDAIIVPWERLTEANRERFMRVGVSLYNRGLIKAG